MKRIATVGGTHVAPVLSSLRAAVQQCPLWGLRMSVANSLVRSFLLVTLGYNQVEDIFCCWLLVISCWLLFAGCLVVWLFGWLFVCLLLCFFVCLFVWLVGFVFVVSRCCCYCWWWRPLGSQKKIVGDPGIPMKSMNLPTIYLQRGASQYMGVSKNRGTPKCMVKIMENPIEMDDLGGFHPPF